VLTGWNGASAWAAKGRGIFPLIVGELLDVRAVVPHHEQFAVLKPDALYSNKSEEGLRYFLDSNNQIAYLC
jgi:hypothetical protein